MTAKELVTNTASLRDTFNDSAFRYKFDLDPPAFSKDSYVYKCTTGKSARMSADFMNLAGDVGFIAKFSTNKDNVPNYLQLMHDLYTKEVTDQNFGCNLLNELFSFTNGYVLAGDEKDEEKPNVLITCCSSVSDIYKLMYKNNPKMDHSFYHINFTNGLPRNIHKDNRKAFRKVVFDLSKQVNEIIHELVSTEMYRSKEYSQSVRDKFRNMFYTWKDKNTPVLRYYDLRLGILPSIVPKWYDFLSIVNADTMLLPDGLSSQFSNFGATEKDRKPIRWYPFHTFDPYSYTCKDEKYTMHEGFDHTNKENENDNKSISLYNVINDVNSDTALETALITGRTDITIPPTYTTTKLSLESCLSNVTELGANFKATSYPPVYAKDKKGVVDYREINIKDNNARKLYIGKNGNQNATDLLTTHQVVTNQLLEIPVEAYNQLDKNVTDAYYLQTFDDSKLLTTESVIDDFSFYDNTGNATKYKQLTFAQVSNEVYDVGSLGLTPVSNSYYGESDLGFRFVDGESDFKTKVFTANDLFVKETVYKPSIQYSVLYPKYSSGKIDFQTGISEDLYRLQSLRQVGVDFGFPNGSNIFRLNTTYLTNEIHTLSSDTTITDNYYVIHIMGGITKDNSVPKGKKKKTYPNYGYKEEIFFAGNCDKDTYEKKYKAYGKTLDQLLSMASSADDTKKKAEYLTLYSNRNRVAYTMLPWNYDLVRNAWETTKAQFFNPKKAIYEQVNAGAALLFFFMMIYTPSVQKDKTNEYVNNYLLLPTNSQGHVAFERSVADKQNNALGSFSNNMSVSLENLNKHANDKIQQAIRNNVGDKDTAYRRFGRKAAIIIKADSGLIDREYYDVSTRWGENNYGKQLDHYVYYNGNEVANRGAGSFGRNNAEENEYDNENRRNQDANKNNSPPVVGTTLYVDVTELNPGTITRNNQTYPVYKVADYKDADQFNWDLPFTDVSSEGKRITDLYGPRDKILNLRGNKNTIPGWHGLKSNLGYQNPNVKVRLPELYVYLMSLRKNRVYTDGQLMPFSFKVYYKTRAVYTLNSIHNTVQPVMNSKLYEEAVHSPGNICIAKTLRTTYAITKNTIASWVNYIEKNINGYLNEISKVIQDNYIHFQAFYRAYLYYKNLPDGWVSKGKTIFNMPILPPIMTFGKKQRIEGTEHDIDNRIIYRHVLNTEYSEPPDIEVVPENKTVKITGIPKGTIKIGNSLQIVGGVATKPDKDIQCSFSDIGTNLFNENIFSDTGIIGFLIPIPSNSTVATASGVSTAWRGSFAAVIEITRDNETSIANKLNENHIDFIGFCRKSDWERLSHNDNLPFRAVTYKDSANNTQLITINCPSIAIDNNGTSVTIRYDSLSYDNTGNGGYVLIVDNKKGDSDSYDIHNIKYPAIVQLPGGSISFNEYMTSVVYSTIERIATSSALYPKFNA